MNHSRKLGLDRLFDRASYAKLTYVSHRIGLRQLVKLTLLWTSLSLIFSISLLELHIFPFWLPLLLAIGHGSLFFLWLLFFMGAENVRGEIW